jgi:hypothetical protein
MVDVEETEIVFVGGEKLRVDGPSEVVAGNLARQGPGGMAELISDGDQVMVNRDAVAYLKRAPSHIPMVA